MYGYHNMIVDEVFFSVDRHTGHCRVRRRSTLHSNHLEVAMGHSSTPLHSAIIGDQEKEAGKRPAVRRKSAFSRRPVPYAKDSRQGAGVPLATGVDSCPPYAAIIRKNANYTYRLVLYMHCDVNYCSNLYNTLLVFYTPVGLPAGVS